MDADIFSRHCERSEAIHGGSGAAAAWIASSTAPPRNDGGNKANAFSFGDVLT
jgi:hypothetical protein